MIDDAVLSFDGIGVTRSRNPLLRDIDWTVYPDERWVILGPNGAGKTTLLSIAAGQLHPTVGSAIVLGEKLGRTDVWELRTRIGITTAKMAERIPGEERVLD